MNKDKEKEKIKKKLKDSVELSKNLKEPTNKEQQILLDNIKKEIVELSDYVEKIKKK